MTTGIDARREGALASFKTLIVCRGPIAMEALEVAREKGLPRPHIIVSKRELYEAANAFAPWAERRDLYERLHIVDDYRDQDAILAIMKKHGLQGVYVGYGMNAENFEFVRRVEDAGLTPITPPSKVMEFTASKFRAKKHVREKLGIRVLPGSDAVAQLATQEGTTDEQLIAAAESEVEKLLQDGPRIIRLKAVQSGGGKGQRLISQPGQAASAIRQIWAEISARGVGGDKGVLVEANLAHPRHWEVQVLSDGETCVHFGARECSIQNAGSQKFVETSLHPRQFDAEIARLDAKKDAKLIELLREEGRRVEETCNSAVQILKSLGYRGAGTVEFLVAEDGGADSYGKPHFMEINSRIQVEHRVSEAVTRVRGKVVRLVGEQFRIACGEKLGYTQDDITFEGYSTELRINTSNSNFLIGASGSVIERYEIPEQGETFYYDDGGAAGLFGEARRKSWAVPNFDSNFALAVFWDKGQRESYQYAQALLEDFQIHGNAQLKTTRPFHLGVLSLLQATAPYGKVRTDFSEIYLAFVALIYPALAKIKPSEIPGGEPLARLLGAALRQFKAEPSLAIALGFWERRLRGELGEASDLLAGRLLAYLARLAQLRLFPEEIAAIDGFKGKLPAVVKKVLDAVAGSRIYEFKRNEGDLEFFIPENVRVSRERQILIEELRDATVQGVTPRPLAARELEDLRHILNALENKIIEHVGDASLVDRLAQVLKVCMEILRSNSHMSAVEFQTFYDDLRRVKWTIRKANLATEIEGLLQAEVNRAIRVVRGPNVVAHLAGTIFLRPAPGKPNYVQPGEEVKEDETVLCLLENMKMFNEIRAHMTGKIKEVLVENERPVLPGDVLMVIE